jgi:hypothetical protein
MKPHTTTSKAVLLSDYLIAVILLLIPFHALITVFLASHFGHYEAFRLWKEGLLFILTSLSLYTVFRSGRAGGFFRDRLTVIWVIYAAVCCLSGVWALHAGEVNSRAMLTGLISNLRFPLFFLVAYVTALHDTWLKQHWKWLLLAPAVLVAGFGLLQHFVLSPDVLRHVGYSAQTIPASQTVDLKPEYTRLQSTLRGPNPLGVYMVLIITGVLLLAVKDRKRRVLYGFTGLCSAVVLFFTYSRSALLATCIAAGLLLWLGVSRKWKSYLLIAGVILLLGGGGTIYALRNNDHIQNVVFHTDEHSRSPRSSNTDRASGLRAGLDDVLHEPLGRGVGTAGPASLHNDHSPRLAENYYLQIGQEAGVVGLGLFMAGNILVGWRLWLRRNDNLALILLVSLMAISFINLLSHAWADDTIAYLWWGLAGLALALPGTKPKH